MLTEQERKFYTKMAPILLSILFIINLFLFLVIMPLDRKSPLEFFATAKLSRHYEEIAIYLILRPLLAGIVTLIIFLLTMTFTILISKLFTHIVKTPKDNTQMEGETSTKVNNLNNINLRQSQKTNSTTNNTISTQSLNSSNKDKSVEITSTPTNKLVDTSMQKPTVENLSNSKRINMEVRCANCGALNESLNKSCHLCGMEITQKNEQKLKVKKILRYVYASIACVIVMFLHSMLCVALEWERGGGLIPVLLTFGFMSFLWKTITHGP